MAASPGKTEALDVIIEPTAAEGVGAAVLQGHDATVEEDADELLLIVIVIIIIVVVVVVVARVIADHLLDVHAGGEGDGPTGGVAGGLAGAGAGGVRKGVSGVVEPQRGVDARHVVIVAEVRVQARVERERVGGAVERAIRARVVLHGTPREPRHQLVREPDPARRRQRVSAAVPVPLPQRVVVVVAAPLVRREQVAERREPAAPAPLGVVPVRVCHRLVRAQVHHVHYVLVRQVCAGQTPLAVQSLCDRRREDRQPFQLRLVPDVRALLERCAQLVAQRVVPLLTFGDDQDVVGVCVADVALVVVVIIVVVIIIIIVVGVLR